MSSPEFKPPVSNSFEKKTKRATIVYAVLALGTLALGIRNNYVDFQDEAIRRDPPTGSTCTIVDYNDSSIEKHGDTWFEGPKDIVLGDKNIRDVARRNLDPSEIIGQATEVVNYGVCDYPGPSYADGGRRSVVNPDNIDPTKVTIVPSFEFPRSATVD